MDFGNRLRHFGFAQRPKVALAANDFCQFGFIHASPAVKDFDDVSDLVSLDLKGVMRLAFIEMGFAIGQ